MHTLDHDVEQRMNDIRDFVAERDVPMQPLIQSITLGTPAVSKKDQSVTVRGSGFKSGLAVTVTLPGGQRSVLIGRQIRTASDSSFVMLITLIDAGSYSLRVDNPDRQQSNTFPFAVGAQSGAATLTRL